MKKGFCLFLVIVALFALFGCNAQEKPQENTPAPLIGVSLAGGAEPATVALAEAMEAAFPAHKAGYRVAVQCADNDPATQIRQIDELVRLGASCLIIEAVDSVTLAEPLAGYHLPIIACDALLMDTENLYGCVTYDYAAIGARLATQVVTEKALDKEKTKPVTIEFFAGSPQHHGSLLLHQGALEVLQPYIDSGKLVARSGQIAYEDTLCLEDTEAAKSLCSRRLRSGYTLKKPLQVCFAATDAIAAGCAQALQKAGYTEKNWPLLTAIGAEAQSQTGVALRLEKDPKKMAAACLKAAHAAITGKDFPAAGELKSNAGTVPTLFVAHKLDG